jgi:hypothetical protein
MADLSKKISDLIPKKRLHQHLLFWLVIVITYIPLGLIQDTFWVVVLMNMCVHIPQILAAYFIAYVIIPQFTVKKRYVFSVFLFLFSLYFFPMICRILTVHVGEELVRRRPFEQEPIAEIMTDIGKLFFNYVPVLFAVSFQFLFVKFFFNYTRTKDSEMLLSKQKAEAELKTLKAQLNPHFLFNTLNNIYSLSLDNSPKTPLAIGKLSEILDHVLYKCNDQLVSLSSEISLLENYIDLEKLRYDERLEVNMQTDISNEIQIPPLILLSLVENAFKHGAGEDSGSPKIWIAISSNDRIFRVEITNTISGGYVGGTIDRIGLSNIRLQLGLIYAGGYTLQTEASDKMFKVVLEIGVAQK